MSLIIKRKNAITACSLTLQTIVTTTPTYTFKKKRSKKRRHSLKNRRQTKKRETNEKFLHNLSSHQLTDSQVSLLSRGLKFIPTPETNETKIRQQLLRDFEQFARRMRLLYIFHGKTENHILFMLNQLGCPRFNTLLPLRATWKMSKHNLLRSR